MSKITDGFENRFEEMELQPPYFLVYCKGSDVKELLEHARKLEVILKKLEWSSSEQDMGARWQACPICRGSAPYRNKSGSHSPDCELNTLLG